MLSVIHTIGGLHPDSGGPARTVTSLCASLLDQLGVDVRLLTQRFRSEEIYNGQLDRKRLIFATTSFPLFLKSGYRFRQKLENEISQSRPDILHDHGIWLSTNYHSAIAAKKRGIPYVVHTRGMLEPWALSFRAQKKRLAWRIYQRKSLELAAVFFATSVAEADNIRGLGFPQPIAIIPNGVNLPEYDLQSKQDRPVNRQRNAVFMSRIHPKKGLLGLVRAWSKLCPAGWKLILAGPDEGGHLGEVLALAIQLGLEDSVEYQGVVDGETKSELLKSADLFVLPSFSENFGIVVAEALAYGVPVISTLGTPWQGLVQNKCGWWVAAEVDVLADAMREAMALSDGERYRMGLRGQQYARQFDWEQIGQETADVYHWLLGQGATPACVRLD